MRGCGEVDFWTAADGARLALRREPERGARRAAIIILHGFGDHSGRYAHVAGWLAERGVAVFALDQRGQGSTPGPRGHVARFSQFLSDVAALRKLVQSEAPGPQLLLGHSFGGLVVMRYLETAPQGLAGAILSSPFVDVAMHVPRWKTMLGRALADLLPSFPVKIGVRYQDICRDPAVGEAVKADPLCHDVMSPRAYRETMEAQAALGGERGRISVPLLFVLAGDDRIVSTPAALGFAAALSGDVTVKVYEGFYHEVLKEQERGRVLADLEPWLARIVPAA